MLCYDHNGSAHVDTGRRTGKTHSASLGKFKNRDVRRTTETQRGDVRRTTETQCVAQEQRTRTESTSNKTLTPGVTFLGLTKLFTIKPVLTSIRVIRPRMFRFREINMHC